MVRDTTREGTRRYQQLLRAKSAGERLEMASALTSAVRELALAGIRERSPYLTERQLQSKLAELLYGREVACRLFGDDGAR
ncbi:MAG: hypothetical protein IPI67_31205 [Myxococcales bacterium]|nr:hypothetical protein [Myxococcales bacterium]